MIHAIRKETSKLDQPYGEGEGWVSASTSGPSRNYFGILSSARRTPGIAEEFANIRRGIFIISDNRRRAGAALLWLKPDL